MKTARHFVLGGVLLTAASLVIRTLQMGFTAYVSGKIGTEGMGLYQLILSVYSLGITLAAGGMRLASTRLIAAALGQNCPGQIRHIMNRCLSCSVVLGVSAALLLFLAAPTIGTALLGDPDTVPCLQVLAWGLPLLAVSCTLSGYFLAQGQIMRDITGQLLEQLLRFAGAALLLPRLLPLGNNRACLGLAVSGAAAECLSALAALLLYRGHVCRYPKQGRPSGRLSQQVLGISLPVTCSALARSGLATLKRLLIPAGLQAYGQTRRQALAAYGLLSGMVLPMLLYPAVLLQAFSDLLVPRFAALHIGGEKGAITRLGSRVLQISLLFSIGVAGMMHSFAPLLAYAVYHTTEPAAYLALFAPLIPIMYIDTAVDSMLKGLGQQVAVMGYNVVDSLCGALLVYTLLPRMGIAGYVVTTFVTEGLNTLLSLHRLLKIAPLQLSPFACLAAPVFGIWGATALSRLLLLPVPFGAPWASALCHIALAGLFYMAFLYLSNAVTKEDIRWGLHLFG